MEKLAEFIGIMLGDGSLSSKRLKITLNATEDAEYAYYISELVQDIFLINPILKKRNYEPNTLDLFIFKRKVIRYLINKVGLIESPKWNRAVIPPKFFSNSRLANLVIRGYFDTDGCVVITNNNGTLYPRLEMKVCPSPMQAQFIKILKNQGFKFGAYKIGKGKVRIQLNGVAELKKWNNIIGFSNKRNFKKANLFLKKRIAGAGFEPATSPSESMNLPLSMGLSPLEVVMSLPPF